MWPQTRVDRLRLIHRHLVAGGAGSPSHQPTTIVLPKTGDNTLDIYARTENAGVTETGRMARLGLGRIVALDYRSSILYQKR
jgi:hypothetical protein